MAHYSFSQVKGGKYVLSIENHQELVSTIKDFCVQKGILAGEIHGIGAVNSATLRFLDPATFKYVDKTFTEQMEITNLIGNISSLDGEVYLHLHITLGRRDYTTLGGHLLCATLNGACELVVESWPEAKLPRKFDEKTGLNLYDI